MKLTITLIALVSFLAVPASLRAQSEVGTWKLNTAKSKYTGTTARQSTTTAIEAQGDGIRVHSVGTLADGSAFDYSYSAKYDGKDNPVSGTGTPNGADTVSVKRINANTTENTFKKGGKVVLVGRISISADGKTRTATGKGTSPDGKPTSNHLIYDKQ